MQCSRQPALRPANSTEVFCNHADTAGKLWMKDARYDTKMAGRTDLNCLKLLEKVGVSCQKNMQSGRIGTKEHTYEVIWFCDII